VVNSLHNQGHKLSILDNEHLGVQKNIPSYFDVRRFLFSITDKKQMRYLQRFGFDYILHFAAYSSAPMFYEEPSVGFNVNVNGFRNVLNLAREVGAKVIYASTSSLYSLGNGFTENSMVYPNSYYEYTKYCNEIESILYWKEHEVKSVGLRLFSIYGYNELHKKNYANLVSQFLWDMEKGNSPVIYGGGNQTRDFVFVEDVCKVVDLLMGKTWGNSILNVGTGISHSLNEMVKILNEELGSSIKPVYIKNPIPNYVQHTKADTEKIKFLLKYTPSTSLREGIKKLIRSKSF